MVKLVADKFPYTYYTCAHIGCANCNHSIPMMAYIPKRKWYKPWTWYQPTACLHVRSNEVLEAERKQDLRLLS